MLDLDHDSRIASSQHTAQITIELIKASKTTVRYFRTAILQTERKISRTKDLLRTLENGGQPNLPPD